jgi:TolB-like protein
MKRTLLAITLLLLGAFAFSQQPVVAVAPFNVISGVSAADANVITRVFFIRLGNTRQVQLRDNSVVEQVLREHNFQTGDWSNRQKSAEVGKALNADWIVRGELESFGNNILVSVQFYDIKTFAFMGGTDALLDNAQDAYNKMDPLVGKLVETIINGNPPQPARSVTLSFSGDKTLAAQDKQRITSGLRNTMQDLNIGLDLIENSNEKAAYNFDVIIYMEKITSGYLRAQVSITFSNNNRILYETDWRNTIIEPNEASIARRIAERIQADKAFFEKVKEYIK